MDRNSHILRRSHRRSKFHQHHPRHRRLSCTTTITTTAWILLTTCKNMNAITITVANTITITTYDTIAITINTTIIISTTTTEFTAFAVFEDFSRRATKRTTEPPTSTRQICNNRNDKKEFSTHRRALNTKEKQCIDAARAGSTVVRRWNEENLVLKGLFGEGILFW